MGSWDRPDSCPQGTGWVMGLNEAVGTDERKVKVKSNLKDGKRPQFTF